VALIGSGDVSPSNGNEHSEGQGSRHPDEFAEWHYTFFFWMIGQWKTFGSA
jgi:hypothetical protein